MEHNVDRQELWDPLKWKAVPCFSASFLHYPDSLFNFGYVLIGICQVYQWSTCHRFDQGLDRYEFAISVHRRDVKSSLEIIFIHLLECLENLRNSPIREMIDSRETDLAKVSRKMESCSQRRCQLSEKPLCGASTTP
jgi:hypothetical protein